MKTVRKVAYSISGIAVLCFFLFPLPKAGVFGALILQTLAFIVIAGKSTPDGLLLTGISFLLIGLLPGDHPLVTNPPFFENVRWVLLGIGAAFTVGMLALIVRRSRV